MRFKTLIVLGLIALPALTATGCGGKKASPSPATPATPAPSAATTANGSNAKSQTLALATDPGGQLKFDKSSLTAKAGDITIELTNSTAVQHDVAVEKSGGGDLGVSNKIASGATKLSLKGVKPGKYKFYCTVPGHEAAGMSGTLTVK